MTRERWQRVKQILEEILVQDSDARAAHLASACGGDDALRRDVESFLASEPGDDFLEQPAVAQPPAVPDAAVQTPAAVTVGDVDEIRPADLAPYSTLVVFTRTSTYELVIVAPLDLEVLVKGGRRFPDRTRAQLNHQDAIRVGEELRLVVGTRKVVTTAIERIEVRG